MGSRGSVIPFFMSVKDTGVLPITDPRMTRLVISLEQCVELVWHVDDMVSGEIYVKKIPSMKVMDIPRVVAPEAQQEIIGAEDFYFTYEYPEHYKILPQANDWANDTKRFKDGIKVPQFVDKKYASTRLNQAA